MQIKMLGLSVLVMAEMVHQRGSLIDEPLKAQKSKMGASQLMQ